MKKINHSKYRNTGLIFELLVRQITVDVLNESDKSAAADIIREFYKDTELSKEYGLYDILINESFNSREKAKDLIDRVVETRRKLDENKLNDEKYDLVGRIEEHYPRKDFFKTRIDKYKQFASIYKIFEAGKNDDKVYNPVSVMESEDTLVEHITGETSEPKNRINEELEFFKEQSREVKMLAQKLITERFNKKYNGLNEKQKRLLRKFIENVSNTNHFPEYMEKEVVRLKENFMSMKDQIDDKVTRVKVEEAIDLIENLTKGHRVYEDQVTNMLVYYQLEEEIQNALKS